MKTLHQSLLLAIGAFALASAAYSAQPPDVVASDGSQNTAMGTDALLNLTPGVNPSGWFNTAAGYEALYSNTTGDFNTALGSNALWTNTTGFSNTATGGNALYSNSTGYGNTATGADVLYFNTTGANNSAFGQDALYGNTTGSANTAVGFEALYDNLGSGNTALGDQALVFTTTGNYNTAAGVKALAQNKTGTANTAAGYGALYGAFPASGNDNTASGYEALYSYSTGSDNTASGAYALYGNTTGKGNIAVGYKAGYNLTTGNDNIDIGNLGTAAEAKTIKIGIQGTQVKTFIAGIYNVPLSGNAVVVTSTGQLGVAAVSSERFKTAIEPMGFNSAKLKQLRPVIFKLKSDATRTRQYGLIAEEVAKVYPELVIRGQNGQIDGVRYDELAPMLLNEVQQQLTQTTEKFDAQAAQIRELKQELAELKARK